jgi:hypothetical protein
MVDCLEGLYASPFTTAGKSVVEESDGAQVLYDNLPPWGFRDFRPFS